MNATTIHFAAGLKWKTNGWSIIRDAGWPPCVSGGRARRIARDGRQSRDRAHVTCRACLKLISKVEAIGGTVGTDEWMVKR